MANAAATTLALLKISSSFARMTLMSEELGLARTCFLRSAKGKV